MQRALSRGDIETIKVADLSNGSTLSLPAPLLGSWMKVPQDVRDQMIEALDRQMTHERRKDE